MKKILFIISICIFFINVPVYAEQAEEPKVNAQAAILIDAQTGRVLWEKDSKKPMAMASTTKIMTAITAIENGNLDDIVVASKNASITPPVKMGLREGEEIKLKDLLYALMMQSSNDAAVAIAEHIGGSVENFCSMMTENAKKIGAVDTVFRTPNGLDSLDHHSNAYDMALITRYALNNEQFYNIINTKNVTFKSSKATYDIINKNRLLNEYSGANGVKTGYTGKAGQCFVGAAKRDGMQLISVVLASGWGDKGKEQKWIDSKRILDYGFKNFKYTEVIHSADKTDKYINVNKAKTDKVLLDFKNSVVFPLKEGEENLIKIEYNIPEMIDAPITRGQKIGTAKIYLDDSCFDEIDLMADSSIERHDFNTSFMKIINVWLNMISKCIIN